MRTLSCIILVFVYQVTATFGQNKPAAKNTPATLLTDCYKGNIPAATELMLQHRPYADDGTFLLRENKKTGSNGTMETKGEWTVLRGDATDENATVVELDSKGMVLYFLRKKDGNLQRLDTSLHAMKPASGYMLHKEQCNLAK